MGSLESCIFYSEIGERGKWWPIEKIRTRTSQMQYHSWFWKKTSFLNRVSLMLLTRDWQKIPNIHQTLICHFPMCIVYSTLLPCQHLWRPAYTCTPLPGTGRLCCHIWHFLRWNTWDCNTFGQGLVTEPKCEWIIGHKEASKEVIHEVVSLLIPKKRTPLR